MYSLENGRATDYYILCQSGFSYKNSELKVVQCASITVSNSTCDEKHKCKYLIDNGSKSEEVSFNCLTNNEGEYFCPQLTGSQAFKDYVKIYKENPNDYKGSIIDISMIIRVALTSKSMTPDLYEIMKLLGVKNIKERIEKIK